MVRPESCVELAGVSPVPVSAKTPDSWPQFQEVIPGIRARRQAVGGPAEAGWPEGAKLWSVTSSEPCSVDKLKTERWKGPTCHLRRRQQTANRDLEMARWTFTAYGGWNATTVRRGTGETLPDRGESREKVALISLRTNGREVGRESEGVVVLEDKDNITLSSPKGQGKGPCLSRESVQEVSARECL